MNTGMSDKEWFFGLVRNPSGSAYYSEESSFRTR